MIAIETAKEKHATDTPLFLFECKMPSGAMERWSTHTVSFEGELYRARVLGHSLFELKLSSDDGADTGSKISLSLANADAYFSTLERAIGMKGAQLTVRFVFFDLLEGKPATDSRVVFRGIAGSPDEITDTALRVTFTNRLSLQRVALPQVRIQKRCPWAFPANAEQRQEAVGGGDRGEFSAFFRCGYSAGVQGGCGNLAPDGQPFTTCGYTKTDCVARGMYSTDDAGRTTARFGGIQFVPSTISVRGYGEKDPHASAVLANEAKYNDVAPLLYGTAWYTPPVVCSRNDGNLTRMEVLLGAFELERVIKVLVNDIEIPEAVDRTNMTGTGWYKPVTNGARSGAFNADFTDGSQKPLGDPYGSMVMLSVVVPNRVSTGTSLPRVEVLAAGAKVHRFDSAGVALGKSHSNNPAWVLLDILFRAGWDRQDIDLGSFARCAAYLEEPVPAKDLNGNATSVPRFQCNLPLEKRRSAAELVRGIRCGSMTLLSYGPDGRLQLRIEGSLRAQQPDKPASSNSVEALESGWPAYEFSDGSRQFSGILCRDNGEPWFRVWCRSAAETTNRVSVEFQDEFNEYQQDSLSLVDVEDARLTGQEVHRAMPAIGLPNFDQAARVLSLALRKSISGNVFVEFGTSVRAFGLTPGDLVAVSYANYGFDRTIFRVLRVAPSPNYRTAVITAQLHENWWYEAGDFNNPGGRRRSSRTRLPRPLVGIRRDEEGVAQFKVSEMVRESSDGPGSVLLRVAFEAPVRTTSETAAIPVLSLTPEIRLSGGQLPAGTYYYGVTAVDGSGSESAMSFSVRAAAFGEQNHNSVTLRDLSFGAGTVSFRVYRGSSPDSLLLLEDGLDPVDRYVDDGSRECALAGPPDPNYDHANFYWRVELQPEIEAGMHGTNTIGNGTLSMTANEFRGALARVTRGRGAGQERRILANDKTMLTVAPPWDIEPDSTSWFAVAESSWRFGALAADTAAEFEIPNRTHATVQICGRSANVHDEECAAELSPLTRWRIGAGTVVDEDIPPAPRFGLSASGDGAVEVLSVSFENLANTSTIKGLTLTLWHVDELAPSPSLPLGADIDEETKTLMLPVSAAAGDLFVIDRELISVVEVLEENRVLVRRGSHGSQASGHGATTAIQRLQRRVEVLPSVKDFFGSPASGSYAYSIKLPDVHVVAAEMFGVNRLGMGATSKLNFLGVEGRGLRTLSGGQYSIQVGGFLARQLDVAPPLIVEASHAIRDIFAVLGSAPLGGEVTLLLKADGKRLAELTIADGVTSSSVADGLGLPPLTAGARLTLDVISVPEGGSSFPGRDLNLMIRL